MRAHAYRSSKTGIPARALYVGTMGEAEEKRKDGESNRALRYLSVTLTTKGVNEGLLTEGKITSSLNRKKPRRPLSFLRRQLP